MKHSRSRNLIRRSITLRVALGIVDANQHTRVILRISTRKANRRSGLRSRASNIDLRTAHVELSALGFASRVQGDDLRTEKVLAWRDAGGEREVDPAVAGEHAVDAP